MKKFLIFLLVLLFPLTAYADCPFTSEGGVQKFLCDVIYGGGVTYEGDVTFGGEITAPSLVKKTTGNLTLYVREAGNDANDCLTVGTACRQIQKPVNLVPRVIDDGHDVLIDVGEGSFTASNVDGFSLGFGSTFTIQGTLGIATGLTGRNSGTTTGAGTIGYHRYFDDSTAENQWVANELDGKFWYCGGDYYVIITNTATRVEVADPNGCVGSYEIHEHKTLLTGNGALGYGPLEVTNIKAPSAEGFLVQKFKTTYGSAVGFLFYDATGKIQFCNATGQWYNFAIGQSARLARLEDVFCGGTAIACYAFFRTGGMGGALEEGTAERAVAVNTSGTGFFMIQSVFARLQYVYAANSGTGSGLAVEGVQSLQVEHSEFRSNAIGITVDFSTTDIVSAGSLVWLENVVIEDNDGDGIAAYDGSHIFLDYVVGTGNGDVGVELFSTATLTRDSSALTLTGDNGDFTLNGGTNIFTWATELNSSGDIVVNIDNGCRAWWR